MSSPDSRRNSQNSRFGQTKSPSIPTRWMHFWLARDAYTEISENADVDFPIGRTEPRREIDSSCIYSAGVPWARSRTHW